MMSDPSFYILLAYGLTTITLTTMVAIFVKQRRQTQRLLEELKK